MCELSTCLRSFNAIADLIVSSGTLPKYQNTILVQPRKIRHRWNLYMSLLPLSQFQLEILLKSLNRLIKIRAANEIQIT